LPPGVASRNPPKIRPFAEQMHVRFAVASRARKADEAIVGVARKAQFDQIEDPTV